MLEAVTASANVGGASPACAGLARTFVVPVEGSAAGSVATSLSPV